MLVNSGVNTPNLGLSWRQNWELEELTNDEQPQRNYTNGSTAVADSILACPVGS